MLCDSTLVFPNMQSTTWQEALMKDAFCPKRRFQYRGTIHCVTMYIVRVSFPRSSRAEREPLLTCGRPDNLVSTGSDGFSEGW